MKTRCPHSPCAVASLAAAAALSLFAPGALADGSETLGPPTDVALAAGSGFVVGGVGLTDTNGGTIDVEVPTNAVVQQVLLYWQGASDELGGDPEILVNDMAVTGTLIGGPTQIFPGVFESAYRADLTSLGLVVEGSNTLELAEVEFSMFNNGAGLIVILSNAPPAELALVDGHDFALENYLSPLDETEPQRFNFASAKAVRTAHLALLVGGGEGLNTIRIWTGGRQYSVVNELASTSGPTWDSLVIEVDIPPRATSLTVQVLSGDGSQQPGQASLISWVAAALAVPPGAPASSNRPPRVVLFKTERVFCGTPDGTARAKVRGRVSDPDCDTLTVDWFVNDMQVSSETVFLSSARPHPIELVHDFPVGTNMVYAQVFDGTNTVYSATNSVVVRLDDVAPELTCRQLKPKKANPHGWATIPAVPIKVRDDCTPARKLVKTQEPRPGTKLPVGIHEVTVTVTDLAGNTSTCVSEFVVKPHKSPKAKKSKKSKKSGKPNVPPHVNLPPHVRL